MLSYSVGSNRLPATRPADAGCQKRNDLLARELNPAFGSAGKWIDRFGPAFCICYFFWLASVGLKAFFTHDDALNLVHLHGYFHVSIFEILQQALTVVSADYRPVGGLFYRLMYAVFGFDPFPFRAAAFALMGANLALTYNLVRTLSGSREAALTAAFLLGYNASFVELYHSTGTIYDILCFGFFVGAFQIYINSRSIGENFTIKRVFCIFILYGCALGSKEMAVTFPIVLILYELFYHRRQFRIRNVLASLFKPHLLAVAGLAMLTAAYAAAKTASAAFSTNSLYSPDFSFGVFTAALHHYLPRWLHLTLDETGALVLVGAAAAVACSLRAKELMFGVCFVIATLLPAAFIPLRGGFVFYLPALGCALFLGSAGARAAARLFAMLTEISSVEPRRRRSRSLMALRAVPFLALVTVLTPIHLDGSREIPGFYYYEKSRKIISYLQRTHPNLPDGSRIYFDDDPYTKTDWTLPFMIQLAYDNPTLSITRGKVIGSLSPWEYDFHFTFKEGQVEPIEPPPLQVASSENVAQIRFQPETGRPGEEISVQVGGFAGKAIDVYWEWKRRLDDGGFHAYSTGASVNWCAVDASGFCVIRVPKDFPPSSITILYAREADAQGEWHTAHGVLEVTR